MKQGCEDEAGGRMKEGCGDEGELGGRRKTGRMKGDWEGED